MIISIDTGKTLDKTHHPLMVKIQQTRNRGELFNFMRNHYKNSPVNNISLWETIHFLYKIGIKIKMSGFKNLIHRFTRIPHHCNKEWNNKKIYMN